MRQPVLDLAVDAHGCFGGEGSGDQRTLRAANMAMVVMMSKIDAPNDKSTVPGQGSCSRSSEKGGGLDGT